jgi:hypothetical protein
MFFRNLILSDMRNTQKPRYLYLFIVRVVTQFSFVSFNLIQLISFNSTHSDATCLFDNQAGQGKGEV